MQSRARARRGALAASVGLAASGILGTGAAWAGSAAQPGQSLGLPVGAQIPHGLYLITTSNFGVRETTGLTPINVNGLTLAWATPWDIAGGRLQLFAGGSYTAASFGGTPYQSGLGQPLLAGQLAWDLGNDFGFSYLIGGYLPNDTRFLTQSPSLTHRFAGSYIGNNWNVTAHLFYGHFLEKRSPFGVLYPDYMNLDFTVMRTFGKWQLGGVAFASTDLPTGAMGARPQGQIAVGGLVGYNFGPVTLQTYVTRDVVERNYGGRDTRAWVRAIIPLYQDRQEAAPNRPLVTREQSQ
ncbi:MAG: transporter [Methylobacterium frigidaeris]